MGSRLMCRTEAKKTRVMKIIEYKKTDADYSGSWTQIFGDTASQLYTRVY